MKKLLVLMLAAALALSLVACGGGGDNPNNNNTTPDTQGTQDIQQDDIQQDDVQQEPEPIIYNFGDSVTSPSGMFVFTPTFDGFAAAVGTEHVLFAATWLCTAFFGSSLGGCTDFFSV